jgi:RNA polymerase sigma-70 factor (ECF subfamily)
VEEQIIIDAIIAGDRTSFKELVDNYQSLVLNTCNSFLHNRHTAEDLTQEVFIEAYLSVNKFNKKSKISTWLYRIAVNKSLNYIRDNKKWDIIKSVESLFKSDYDRVSEDSEARETEERLNLLHQSIDSLPKKQNIAFTLSKLDNLSYKEIAEVMELSLSSVEGLVHRAKQSVQKKITHYYKNK